MKSPARRRRPDRADPRAPKLSKQLAAQIGIDDDERTWFELGAALDGAVRSTRARDPLAEGLARRAHTLWVGLPMTTLMLKPTELINQRHQVLAADGQRGDYLLPAYMAGLRSLELRPGASPEDVVRLVQTLARLRPETAAIGAFAEWLARDRCDGFRVVTFPPFEALGLALSVRSPIAEDSLGEACQRAVDGWNGRSWVLSRTLDAESAQRRFGRALAEYEQKARGGELELTAEEMQGLRDGCNEDAYWSRVETQAVLAEPALRGGFTARRLAARLHGLISGSPKVGNAVISFLVDLSQQDRYGAQVLRTLDSAGVGETISAKLEVEAVDPALVADVLGTLGAGTATAMMKKLLERAQGDQAARELLTGMVRARGLAVLATHAERIRGVELLARLYDAALIAGEPVARVRTAVEAVALDARVRMLAAAPALAISLSPLTMQVLAESPRAATPLLCALAEHGPDGANLLARVVRSSKAVRKLPDDAWPAVLTSLVRHGFGSTVALPLIRSDKAPLAARVAAVEACIHDESLRAELSSVAGALSRAPRELRAKLSELAATRRSGVDL